MHQMLKWIWLAAVIVVLDQLTKYIASTSLEMFKPIAVMPMFNWTLMHNTGAAFSFLANEGGWQRWFFAVIAVVVSVFLVLWIKQLEKHEKWQAIALALILGGAIGNVIDRVFLGPAFNIADSAIVVGVMIIIIETVREYLAEKKQVNKNG